MALWTCKRDAQWKWSLYLWVSFRRIILWVLSTFARVAFCDLIAHLKFCRSKFVLNDVAFVLSTTSGGHLKSLLATVCLNLYV